MSDLNYQREKKHQRNISCAGYEREDGLFDIEGHLIDRKTYFVKNKDRNGIEPNEPLHDMTICLTVNNQLTIVKARVNIHKSPYHMCSNITDSYQSLEGIELNGQFNKKVRELFHKTKGCVHLNHLLRTLLSTAFQTIYPILLKRHKNQRARPLPGQCHVMAPDSPLLKREDMIN